MSEHLLNSNILISFVTYGRNDGYMGDFNWRLSTNINKIAENFEKLNYLNNIEVLIADWGSSEKSLIESSTLNEAAKKITSYIEVPQQIVRKYELDGEYSYPHGANTAIRRVNGKFILSMDSEVYMPFETAKLLIEMIEKNFLLADSIITFQNHT